MLDHLQMVNAKIDQYLTVSLISINEENNIFNLKIYIEIKNCIKSGM